VLNFVDNNVFHANNGFAPNLWKISLTRWDKNEIKSELLIGERKSIIFGRDDRERKKDKKRISERKTIFQLKKWV